jgi:hypothetical protein
MNAHSRLHSSLCLICNKQRTVCTPFTKHNYTVQKELQSKYFFYETGGAGAPTGFYFIKQKGKSNSNPEQNSRNKEEENK